MSTPLWWYGVGSGNPHHTTTVCSCLAPSTRVYDGVRTSGTGLVRGTLKCLPDICPVLTYLNSGSRITWFLVRNFTTSLCRGPLWCGWKVFVLLAMLFCPYRFVNYLKTASKLYARALFPEILVIILFVLVIDVNFETFEKK